LTRLIKFKFFFLILENIFNYIELIGKCCINSFDLKKLIELLKPNRNFPYSVNLLKCLINISKSNINNIFFNDCLFELLYHNNRNFDLTIINDLKFVLNSSNQHQNVNNNKKINKKYYVQHFIDFSDHSSVGSSLSLSEEILLILFLN
jgi:hypothetical protein